MPRTYKARWHAGNQQWVSDCGEQYVDAKGRARRKTIAFPGIGRKEEAKARKALQAYLDDVAEREASSIDPTFLTVCELYLEWGETNLAPDHCRVSMKHLNRFAEQRTPGQPQNGDRRVSTLGPLDLERYLALMAKDYKPSYCAMAYSLIQATLNWAAKRVAGRVPEVLISSNPFKGVERPKVPRAPERYATRQEIAAFLRWAWRHANRKGSKRRPSIEARFDRQFCLLLRMLVHTGARPSEMCIAGGFVRDRGLKWSCWNPEAGTNSLGQKIGLIVLPPSDHKTGKKTGRPREIVVPPLLTRAIERHKSREWRHPTWVFTHRRGNNAEERGALTAAIGEPWLSQFLTMKIRRWRAQAIAEGQRLKAAGKPTRGLELLQDRGDNRFVMYRLRHTRITDMIGAKGGLSHDQAAALTGTSGRMIETVYGHLTGSRLIDLDQVARRRPGGSSA